MIGLGRPFPYISNLSLSLGVILRDPDQDTEVMARVKVPKELLRRFLPLGDGTTFVPLEDVIASNLDRLFPGMEVLDHALFRVTRDTDYDVSDEADDLLQAVEEEVRRRRFGEVVRLEVEATMSERLRERLVDALHIEQRQVYEADGLLGPDDLFDWSAVPGFAELRYPPCTPVTQPRLQGEDGKEATCSRAMREGDVLVHHPYDSFSTSVERSCAGRRRPGRARDQADGLPDAAPTRRWCPALIEAAERGKQAVCMVELKARFDEQANIRWAKKLEQAGVHVVYGIPALKTHCKCVLVVRREGDSVRHYVHIGTGNYNPKTARLYTDVGLFTADPDLGADIAEMFNYLTGYARPRRYRKALVAPSNLQEDILDEIRRTIEAHEPERPARIRMKMNALLDATSIRALYAPRRRACESSSTCAGSAPCGPASPGSRTNIEVVSVVGRFLEHSRIYSFERNGEQHVFIGSADLMPRNLYNRVELLAPVEDPRLRAELNDVLDRCLADNTHAWDARRGRPLDPPLARRRRAPRRPARADRPPPGARVGVVAVGSRRCAGGPRPAGLRGSIAVDAALAVPSVAMRPTPARTAESCSRTIRRPTISTTSSR